jgi:hypothetical protein
VLLRPSPDAAQHRPLHDEVRGLKQEGATEGGGYRDLP